MLSLEDHYPTKNHQVFLAWRMPTPKLMSVDCSWWSTLKLDNWPTEMLAVSQDRQLPRFTWFRTSIFWLQLRIFEVLRPKAIRQIMRSTYQNVQDRASLHPTVCNRTTTTDYILHVQFFADHFPMWFSKRISSSKIAFDPGCEVCSGWEKTTDTRCIDKPQRGWSNILRVTCSTHVSIAHTRVHRLQTQWSQPG